MTPPPSSPPSPLLVPSSPRPLPLHLSKKWVPTLGVDTNDPNGVSSPVPFPNRRSSNSSAADHWSRLDARSPPLRGLVRRVDALPLFASAAVRRQSDDSSRVSVLEDVAGFAGGAVWRVDWCPTVAAASSDAVKHLAVEVRPRPARGAPSPSDDAGDEGGDDRSPGAASDPSGAVATHTFDELGGARGDATVQIWALRAPAKPSKASSGVVKRKRADNSDPTASTSGPRATAVLGLAHDGGYALDVKWSRDPSRLGSGRGALGVLAVALGNGRVEAWRVPHPDALSAPRETETETGVTPRSGHPPVVRCSPVFVGVLPAGGGAPMSIDWATSAPYGRLAAACSGGAIVLWNVDGREATPALPTMQLASTGRPQRAVAW